MSPLDRSWRRIAFLSAALLAFSVPHTLEDFALGEPLKRGLPLALVSTVVASLFMAQGLALYLVGARHRGGLWMHAVLGLWWPLAAGVAQLPEIAGDGPYRSGALSAAYVFGMIVVGTVLCVACVGMLRRPVTSGA